MPVKVFSGQEWKDIVSFLQSQERTIVTTIRNTGTIASCTVNDFINNVADLGSKAPTEIRGLLTVPNMCHAKNKPRLSDYLTALKRRYPATVIGILAGAGTEQSDKVKDSLPSIGKYAAKALNTANMNSSPLCVDGTGTTTYYHRTEHTPGVGVHIDGSHQDVSTFFYLRREDQYYLVAWGVHTGEGTAIYRVREAVEKCGLARGSTLKPQK